MALERKRTHPDEIELLDILEGEATPYLEIEKFVFDGNRDKALRSIGLMYGEGVICVTVKSMPVELWRIDQWRRDAALDRTGRDLAEIVVALPRAKHGRVFQA